MTFDPLHKWLGIPASEQPPNHYRLLGIPLFEDDLDVIDAAADKQLAFLHDMTNGPESKAAEELSNRVSAARVCLCSKQRKTEYDAQLRGELNAASKPSDEPTNQIKSVSGVLRSAAKGTRAPDNCKLQGPGWTLRYADGIDHGPYPLESLLEAARRGYITPLTTVRHPSITHGDWIQALSLPELARECPAEADAPDSAVKHQTHSFVSTRRKLSQRPSFRSRTVSSIATLVPVLALALLTFAVYRNPELRDALRASIVASNETVEPEAAEEPSATDMKRSKTRAQRVNSDEPFLSERRTAPDMFSGSKPVANAQAADSGTGMNQPDGEVEAVNQGKSSEPAVAEEWHYLRLDLSETRWSAVVPNSGREDRFIIHRIEEVPVTISVEPTSCELGFERTTLVTLDGFDGLGIELRLLESGEPSQVKLTGRVVLNGDDFRYRNLLKQWNDLGRQVSLANAAIETGKARRQGFQAFLDSSGLKPLDRVHQAENEIKAIGAMLPNLTAQRDTLQGRWNQLRAIVERIAALNEKGELVVSVIGPDKSAVPPVSAASGTTR